MKKTYFVLSIIALGMGSITSCKKSSSSNSNPYYVKFKVNDSLITWTSYVVAEVVTDQSDTTKKDFVLLSGSKDQNTTLSLDISADSMPVGTYPSTDAGINLYTEYNFNNDSTNVLDFEIGDATGMPPSTFTLTLTSITTKEIKGTFTGNYLTNPPSGKTVSITAGEFYAPNVPF